MSANNGTDVDTKLDMSLDELLAAKKKEKPPRENGEAGSKHVVRRQNGGGGRHQQGRGRGGGWRGQQGQRGDYGGYGQPMRQQQQQYPQQQQPYQQQGYNNGWQGPQQQMMYYQQQQQPYGFPGMHPQQQQHMQQQQRGSVFQRLGGGGGRGAGWGPGGGGPGGPHPRQHVPNYKLDISQDESTGDVTVNFRGTNIITVHPSGEVVLDTAAQRTKAMLGALNQALNKINLKVTAVPTPAAAAGLQQEVIWNVSDGRSLQRFADGMVVPAKGTATAARGRLLMRANGLTPLAVPSAAAAATQASNAAAVAAGLVPEAGAMEEDAEGGLEVEGEDDPMDGEFVEYGQEQVEAARLRRLKAQGRYNPY